MSGKVRGRETGRAIAVTILDSAGDSAMDATNDAVRIISTANSGVDIGDVTVNNAAGASAVNIQDGGNSITVDGAVSVGSIVSAIPAGDNNIGNVDIVTVPAPLSTTGGGTEATALRVTVASDSTGVLSIDDNAGSLTVDGTVTANLAAGTNNIGDVDVLTIPGIVGTVADDATTPGAPVMIGGQAKSPDGTDPGNVSAENDTVRATFDLNRRLLVNTHHSRQLHKHLNGSLAYTDESVAADPGDGFQIVITAIIASTGAATALNFFLEEGTTTIFGPIYLEAVAGRGFVSGPIYLPITASTAVTLTSSSAILQSYDIDYFIQAV